jgi:hypothetical protein
MPITTPTVRVADYGNDPDHFRHVWEYLFKPAILAANFEPWEPAAIGAQVIPIEVCGALRVADLVLADLSGCNPNVLYELGIRTALDRPVSLVCDSDPTTIPFDLASVNYHRYDPGLSPWQLTHEIAVLAEHLVATARACNGRNDYWQHLAQPEQTTGSVPNPGQVA